MKDKEWFLFEQNQTLFVSCSNTKILRRVSKVVDRGEKRSGASLSVMCDHLFLRNVVTTCSKQNKVWQQSSLGCHFLSCLLCMLIEKKSFLLSSLPEVLKYSSLPRTSFTLVSKRPFQWYSTIQTNQSMWQLLLKIFLTKRETCQRLMEFSQGVNDYS